MSSKFDAGAGMEMDEINWERQLIGRGGKRARYMGRLQGPLAEPHVVAVEIDPGVEISITVDDYGMCALQQAEPLIRNLADGERYHYE